MVRYILVNILVAGLVFQLFGRDWASSVFLVSSALGCVTIACYRFEEALCLFAFILPLEQVFFAWGGGRYNSLTYLSMVLVLLGVRTFKKELRSGFRRTEIFMILWIVTGVLSLIWSEDKKGGMGIILTNTGCFLVLYLFNRGTRSVEQVLRYLWYFVGGTFLMSLVLLGYYQAGTALVWREYRYIPSALGLGLEISPHEYSRSAMIGAVSALALWEFEKKRRRKKWALLLAIFLGSMVPLALSRGTMVALGAAFLAWAFLATSMAGRIKKIIGAFAIIAAVVLISWKVNSEALGGRLEQSVQSYDRGDMSSLTTLRTDVWSVAIDLFLEHPLQGVGLGSFSHEYSRRSGDIMRGSHNAYIESFVETGLVGGTFFLLMIISLGIEGYRAGRWRHVASSWWIASAVTVLTAGLARAKEFFFIFALILVLARVVRCTSQRQEPPNGALHDDPRLRNLIQGVP